MKQYVATIIFKAPAEATQKDIIAFFNELQSAGGCRSPEDPLFESFSDVKVKALVRSRGPKA